MLCVSKGSRLRACLGLFVGALSLVCCAPTWPASSHVSVVSVAHWDDYAEKLKPKFELTGEKALGEVLPLTRKEETHLLSAMMFSFGMQVKAKSGGESDGSSGGGGVEPKVIVNVDASEETEEEEAEGDSAEDGEASEEDGGGGDESGGGSSFDPLTLLDPDFASSISTPNPGSLKHSDTPLGVDPMMKYRAANALFQEVQFLNEQLDHIAVAEGYEPYVVRLKVALMPRTNHEPFDAYLNIGFVDHCGSAFPRVLPLLVTDNMEMAESLRSMRNILALSLAISSAGGTAAGGLSAKHEELRNVLGRDVNSLLTVASLGDSALRVRIGAAQQSSDVRHMVAQTHDLTVLVLLDRKPSEISSWCGDKRSTVEVLLNTEYVHVETGQSFFELKGTKRKDDVEDGLENLYQSWNVRFSIEPEIDLKQTKKLWEVVERGDGYQQVLKALTCERHPDSKDCVCWKMPTSKECTCSNEPRPGICEDDDVDKSLKFLPLDDSKNRVLVRIAGAAWLDLQALKASVPLSLMSSLFEVTIPGDPKALGDALELAAGGLVIDNGRVASVVLESKSALKPSTLTGRIHVAKSEGDAAPVDILPLVGASFDRKSNRLTVHFTSPASVGLPQKLWIRKVELSTPGTTAGARESVELTGFTYRKEAKSSEPAFKVAGTVDKLLAKDGKANFDLNLTLKSASEVTISVTGNAVVSKVTFKKVGVNSQELTEDPDNTVKVTASGRVQLELENLVNDDTFKVTILDKESGKKEVLSVKVAAK